MARTILSPQRLAATRRTNIGHVLLFCEGETEKYYFEYFAEILNKNRFNDIAVLVETVSGNARTVLNYAKTFMEDDENSRKYGTYEKYLVFDCDDPPNIQSVIQDARAFELLVTNHFFETWLLMHFEDLDEKLTKPQTYRRLSAHLSAAYRKGRKGKTREILQNGDIEKAIANAKALETRYRDEGLNICANIREMNPYSSVYSLVEQLMVEISIP